MSLQPTEQGKAAEPAAEPTPLLFTRLPLLPAAALAFTAGIVAARESDFPAGSWLAVAVFCLVLMRLLPLQLPDRTHVLLLIFGIAAAGGARQTVHEDTLKQSVLHPAAAESERPLTLIGTIRSVPVLQTVPAGSYHSGTADRQMTRFRMTVVAAGESGAKLPAPETCDVRIDGNAVSGILCGAQVRITGDLSWPDNPGNPGEFDYARRLTDHGVTCLLFVRSRDAVQVLQNPASWHPAALATHARRRAEAVIHQCVPDDLRPVASAVLLGDRSGISDATETSFTASGAMHLLAISGLHTGVLYVFCLRLLQFLRLPHRRSVAAAVAVCVLYAFITDLRPSVMRATLFLTVLSSAEFLRRRVSPWSVLGLTALILLNAQPWLAVDTGAWLSFLSVAALAYIGMSEVQQPAGDTPADRSSWPDRLRGAAEWVIHRARSDLRRVAAISVVTAPLIASRFYVISLTGLVINLLLIPLTFVILCCGFTMLGLGLLLPVTAKLAAVPFSLLLRLLTESVDAAASVTAGHLRLPMPPGWFLPVFYAAIVLRLSARRETTRFCCTILLMLTAAAGLIRVTWLSPDRATDGFRLTVLDVGHGSSSVLETSDGRVILCDAGSLTRGDRTADIIAGFLAATGHQRIDAVIISHADTDHFNAVEGLLRRCRIGSVMIPADFLSSGSEAARSLCRAVAAENIPVRILRHGDRTVCGKTDIRFLQARLRNSPEAEDNERSLVTVVSHEGHTLLLPGDLDGAGRDALLTQLPECDILISPHHGALDSNPPDLAEAVRPRVVVVSSRDSSRAAPLQKIYPDARIMVTAATGAVEVLPDEDRNLTIRRFLASDTTQRQQPADVTTVR